MFVNRNFFFSNKFFYRMRKYLFALVSIFLFGLTIHGDCQDEGSSFDANSVGGQDDYYNQRTDIHYDNKIYVPWIKTPIVHVEGDVLSQAILSLNGGAPLRVRFDDFSEDIMDYYYTVIHCDSKWYPSDLDQSDYLNGFYENSISDVENSFDTYKDFLHYTFTFPNDMSGVKLSGNYILAIYEDGDMEQLIMTRRFVVYEQLVEIETRVKQATEISERRAKQEVDVNIVHESYAINNPYEDFNLAIIQNNRWDNAILDLKPRFVKGGELDFDHAYENNFDGGNEFRDFNLKDFKFITQQVDRVELIDFEWNAYLMPDPKRSFKIYKENPDLNGRFYIKNDRGYEQHLEADYVWVHFTLPFDFFLGDADVFVFGALSDFQCKEEFRLHYNFEKKVYETKILLKQGYYNYYYSVKRKTESTGDVSIIEGNHYETKNEYTIIAYNYDVAGGYDRVVGLVVTDSFNR